MLIINIYWAEIKRQALRDASLLLLMLVIHLPSHAQGDTIRLASGEWYPYLTESMKHKGAISHVVSEAFASQGVTVEYDFYPWMRTFQLTKSGVYDGSPVWVDMDGRDQFFMFSDIVVTGDNVLFHLKLKPFQWQKLKDLEGKRIGLLLGYSQPSIEMALNDSIERVASGKQNFAKLLRGRIDVFIIDKMVGYSTLRDNFSGYEANQITHHGKVLNSSQYRLMLSRKVENNKHMLKAFNLGMRHLRESGKYKQLMDDFYSGKYKLD